MIKFSDIPVSLIARAEALGCRFESKIHVNFCAPKGEEIVEFVHWTGSREVVVYLSTIESGIEGAEAAIREFQQGVA